MTKTNSWFGGPFSGPRRAYVEPILGQKNGMFFLGLVSRPMWDPCWAYIGPCWAFVGPKQGDHLSLDLRAPMTKMSRAMLGATLLLGRVGAMLGLRRVYVCTCLWDL